MIWQPLKSTRHNFCFHYVVFVKPKGRWQLFQREPTPAAICAPYVIRSCFLSCTIHFLPWVIFLTVRTCSSFHLQWLNRGSTVWRKKLTSIWCFHHELFWTETLKKHAILQHSRKPLWCVHLEVRLRSARTLMLPHNSTITPASVCTSVPFLWQRVPVWLPGKQAFFHAMLKHVGREGWLCFTLWWRIHPMHV